MLTEGCSLLYTLVSFLSLFLFRYRFLVHLQCGAAHLAEYLWCTLQGMGFGAEELLLHACGAGGDLPPLHAAMASGEPPAVRSASLPCSALISP